MGLNEIGLAVRGLQGHTANNMDFWILTGLGLVIFVIMGLWIYLEAKWEREKEEAILLDQLRDLLRDPRK